MKNRILEATLLAFFLTIICALGTAAAAPMLAWVLVLILSGGRESIPNGTEALFGAEDKVSFCISYMQRINQEGFSYALWAIFLLLALISIAALAQSAGTNRSRKVSNGVLGKQSASKGTFEILSRCETWDGKSDPPSGVALGYAAGRTIVFPCVHAAICAPSGSMKTRGSVYPTTDLLSRLGDNLLVTDPSLEIFCASAPCLRKRGYDIHLLDFESPAQGSRYNPLKLISDLFSAGDFEGAEARAREIGAILFPTRGTENDIFNSAASGVFSATAYAVATLPDVPDSQRHLWSVVKTITEGTVSGTDALKGWLRSFGSDSPIVSMCMTFLASEGKLLGSILASLHDGLQPFTSMNMRWLTSDSDLDIDEAMRGKSAVFLHTLGPGSPTNKVAALFFAQHWAETQRLGKKRDLRPCWMIGDEWASIPKYDGLVVALQQSRKFGLHYIMYTQSFSGYDQYRTPKEDGKDAILANCDLKVLYRAGSDKDAQFFETLGGYKTVKARSEGEQRRPRGSEGTSQSYSEQKVPLWPQAEILARNPATDGALVVQSAFGKRNAGKYEVPVVDASRTFVSAHFGTLGTPEFERKVISDTISALEEKASSIEMAVEGWAPKFEAEEKGTEEALAEDEFSAWD